MKIQKDHLGYLEIHIFFWKFHWPLVWLKTYKQSLGYGDRHAEINYKRIAIGMDNEKYGRDSIQKPLIDASRSLTERVRQCRK